MNDQVQEDQQIQNVPQDSDAYVNYYGLTGDPFSPDNPLFFTTPQLEKLLRLFNYLARFSRKLVLVTADSGAGKTALLENFVNEQDEQDLVCFFAALNTDTPEQVLYEIADQLGIDSVDGSDSFEQLIKEIRDYSLQRLDHGENCIVVIDDAHLFDQTVLEQLYQLTLDEAEQRCAVRLLLCGQGSLLELMQNVVPADIVAKTLFHQPIGAFSYDEVVQYLTVHFRENAGHSKPPFSADDYQQIYQQSAGLPGRVDEQAKLLLTEGVGRLVNAENRNKPKGFMVFLGVILLVIGGVFWWQNTHQEPVDVTRLEMTGQIDRAEEMGTVVEGELISEQIFAEPEPPLSEATAEGDQQFPASLQADDLTEISSLELELNSEQSSVALPVPSVVVAVAVTDEALPEQIEAPLLEVDVVAEESMGANLSQTEINSEAPAETQIVEEIKMASVSGKEQEKEAVAQPTQSASRLMRDAERILAFGSFGYTLQLMGSSKEENIVAAIRKLPDDKNLMYFKKVHKGEPWYVLIYGYYADHATASAATASLPTELKGAKPWVRSVLGVQKTVEENQ